jgi:hypothetical protein
LYSCLWRTFSWRRSSYSCFKARFFASCVRNIADWSWVLKFVAIRN